MTDDECTFSPPLLGQWRTLAELKREVRTAALEEAASVRIFPTVNFYGDADADLAKHYRDGMRHMAEAIRALKAAG